MLTQRKTRKKEGSGPFDSHSCATTGGNLFNKLVVLSSFAIMTAAPSVLAQQYPSKPVTIVVPAAVGGPSDTVARVVGAALAKQLQGTVVIENQGGAGGTIGAARVARASADG